MSCRKIIPPNTLDIFGSFASSPMYLGLRIVRSPPVVGDMYPFGLGASRRRRCSRGDESAVSRQTYPFPRFFTVSRQVQSSNRRRNRCRKAAASMHGAKERYPPPERWAWISDAGDRHQRRVESEYSLNRLARPGAGRAVMADRQHQRGTR